MRTAQLYRYTIPVETGVVLRQRRLKVREGLVLHLTDGEQQGWGEIAPLPEFSRETLAQAEQQAKSAIAEWLNGETLDWDAFAPSVAFGFSCALAELENRLGSAGNYRAAPLCYGDLDELYEKLVDLPPEAKVAKLKVGLYEANRDGLIANMLLEAVPDLQLRLDANRAWSPAKAAQFTEKIAPPLRSRIQFIEEPCSTRNLSLAFAEQYRIAIAWDESVHESDFALCAQSNVAAIVIKPTLIGSLEKCVKLIAQAHQLGMMAVISSSIESSLGLTQLARIAQQYTPDTVPGLDTLNLMQLQLIRPWPGSTLPLAKMESDCLQKLL